MIYQKHQSEYAIYTSWNGREQVLAALMEECESLEQAEELVEQYIHPSGPALIVDKTGNILAQYNEEPSC